MNDPNTENKSTEMMEELRNFPVKCDHCSWAGTVGTARLVEGKARCPTCGGSLAANRVKDQIVDGLHALV
ncbi:MAG: hypothetical protein Q7R54_01230, partial [bacterium]|nr:hypothetical protein [bacterium]